MPKEEEDELELYLAEKEESNLSIDLLKYWKKKEIVWPALEKMVKQYLAAPASSAGVERVFSARLARSIVHDDLAEEVGQGFHIGIFAVCCVQHGLVYRLVAALLRIGTMRCVYHARDVLFLDLISGLGISFSPRCKGACLTVAYVRVWRGRFIICILLLVYGDR